MSRLQEVDAPSDRGRVGRAYIRRVRQLVRNIETQSDRQVRSALEFLADARRRIIDEMSSLPQDDNHRYRLETLQSATAAIDRQTVDFARRFGVQLAIDLDTSFTTGVQFLPDALSTAGVNLLWQPEVSRAQLLISQRLGQELVVRVSTDFRQRARRVIQLGIVGAKSVAQMEREMQALLRTQPDRLTKRMGPIASQAEAIVMTESLRTFALAAESRSQELAKQVPEMRHYWLSAGDGRVRPAHAIASGRYAPGSDPGPIPKRQAFIVGGERMMHPHDPAGSAGNVIRCRCIAVDWNPEWFAA